MKHTLTTRKDVENHLALLPLTEVIDIENRFRLDLVHDMPVQPCERQLDIETRVRVVEILAVVNLIDLVKNLESLFTFSSYSLHFQVNGVLHPHFIVLTASDQPFKNVLSWQRHSVKM